MAHTASLTPEEKAAERKALEPLRKLDNEAELEFWLMLIGIPAVIYGLGYFFGQVDKETQAWVGLPVFFWLMVWCNQKGKRIKRSYSGKSSAGWNFLSYCLLGLLLYCIGFLLQAHGIL